MAAHRETMLSRGNEPGTEFSRERITLNCEQYSREMQLSRPIL